MSDDDDWGSEDDGDDAAENDAINVWQKYHVGVAKSFAAQAPRSVSQQTSEAFASELQRNLVDFTSQFYHKMTANPRENVLVPVYYVYETNMRNSTFMDHFELDSCTSRITLPMYLRSTRCCPIWKFQFGTKAPNRNFRVLGQMDHTQGQSVTCTMLELRGTQELWGEHNWENIPFFTLTLRMDTMPFVAIFVYPASKDPDKLRMLERLIFKERFNGIKQIREEQREMKMDIVAIPECTIQTLVDFSVPLKRLGFHGARSRRFTVSCNIHQGGAGTPQAAPPKRKAVATRWKRETEVERQQRTETFVCDCPFLMITAHDVSHAPVFISRIVKPQ